MPLLNVRLGPDDERAVAELRRAGANVSEIVRRAIRTESERQRKARLKGLKPSEIIARIHAEIPDEGPRPPDWPDLRDRRAVRQFIVDKLRRRR